MTLKVIPRLLTFSSAIRRKFVQYVTRFQLIASVKLHYYGRRTISGKLLAFGFCFVTTMQLLSNYFDLLLSPSTQANVGLYWSSVEDRRLLSTCSRSTDRLADVCCRLPALTDRRLPVDLSTQCHFFAMLFSSSVKLHYYKRRR